MIDRIAYEIVRNLASKVNFMDKWAGLVRPLRKKVQNVDKVFPVAINTPSNCDQSDYTALVPDSTKRSVVYIEQISAPTVEVMRHNSQQMTATLRLVVWYNLDLITAGDYLSEDILLDQILDYLPKRLSDSLFNGVKQVHLLPTKVIYGTEIVSQYTYNEIKFQFGTHPYGMFAVDLDVWYISVHCQNPVGIETGCVTGKGNHETYPLPEPSPIQPPELENPSVEIGEVNAVFTVDVSTGGGDTDVVFQWGTEDGVYSNVISVGTVTENGQIEIIIALSDFPAGEIIYWQFVATNSEGTDSSVQIATLLNQIPEGAIKFENTEEYIFFEGDETEEYITFETT